MTEWRSGIGKTMRLEEGDITRVEADAIVNAANSLLVGGGGVDGAIHRAAGPTVMVELDEIRAKIGHCPVGQAVATKAGKLRALYSFHAVGPVNPGGGEGEAEQLASCYRECLSMAAERDLRSIAFPAISTGAYGYPLEEAARIAVREIREVLERPGPVNEVRVVLFNKEALRAFERC